MMIRRLDVPEAVQIPAFVKTLDDLECGNNVLYVGSGGTGKTTLAEKVAYSFFGRRDDDGKEPPFKIINCNQWTSPLDLIGGQTIDGYKEGRLIEAWREGKILILDEIMKLDPNTAGILNDALAKSAKKNAIIFNGKGESLAKNDYFGCIATSNTLGKGNSGNYVGNNKQDASLLDRFSGSIFHIGFNEVLERQLVYPTLVEICLLIRRSILKYEGIEGNDDNTEDIMTLRSMLNLQRTYELEMKRELGLKNSKGQILKRVPNGKTLKDGLESYFFAMNPTKANVVKEEVNIEGFYNTYRGSVMKERFLVEHKRRSKIELSEAA